MFSYDPRYTNIWNSFEILITIDDAQVETYGFVALLVITSDMMTRSMLI